jgi:hypothetical protein
MRSEEGRGQGRGFKEDTRCARGIGGVRGCACEASQSKQHTGTPPDLMQMGGRARGQKDEGEGVSPKKGVWKGVGKTFQQDTHRRAVVVCLSLVCVGVWCIVGVVGWALDGTR